MLPLNIGSEELGWMPPYDALALQIQECGREGNRCLQLYRLTSLRIKNSNVLPSKIMPAVLIRSFSLVSMVIGYSWFSIDATRDSFDGAKGQPHRRRI